jgi:hypothetical protein
LIRDKGELTIVVVVTNNYLLNLTKLAHLAPKVLVERIKVILQLTRVHLVLRVIGGILVHVWKEDCLRVGWLDVFPRAAIAMSACADLVVERAVDFVLLRAKDRC